MFPHSSSDGIFPAQNGIILQSLPQHYALDLSGVNIVSFCLGHTAIPLPDPAIPYRPPPPPLSSAPFRAGDSCRKREPVVKKTCSNSTMWTWSSPLLNRIGRGLKDGKCAEMETAIAACQDGGRGSIS